MNGTGELDDDLLAVSGRKRTAQDEIPGVRKKRGVALDNAPQPVNASQVQEVLHGADTASVDPTTDPSTNQAADAPADTDEKQEEEEEEDDDDDDDESSDEDEFAGLATDREDRKWLKALPELEREMELTRRSERLDNDIFRQRLFKGKEPTQGASGVRATGSAASDDEKNTRRSARQQSQAVTKATKMDMLKDMKASRERTAAEETAEAGAPGPPEDSAEEEEDGEEPVAPRGAPPSPDDAVFSDAADGADAHEDYSDGGDEHESSVEAGKDEVLNMQVTRSALADWIKHPHLDNTLLGAVVRMSCSSHEREPHYSMCLVSDVTTGKPYTFSGEQGQTDTDKYLVIMHAGDQKQHTISFALVSNSQVREEEYSAFHEERAASDMPQITKREARDVLQKLALARVYTLSREDVENLVKEKKAKGLIRMSLAQQKAELTMKRKGALASDDIATAERTTMALEHVKAQIQEQQRLVNTETQTLQALNRKARNENNARRNAARSRMTGGGKDAGYDPYSRKHTQVVQYWSTGNKPAETQAGCPLEEAAAVQQKKLTVEEELASIQLKTHKANTQSLLSRRMLGPQYVFTRTTQVNRLGKEVISLERYQEKIGREKFHVLGLG